MCYSLWVELYDPEIEVIKGTRTYTETTYRWRVRCRGCGTVMESAYGNDCPPETCSDRCRQRVWRAMNPTEPAEPTERPCEHCGEPFEARRRDARYCSGRCRTAAHRAKG
jgi:hypothetical protein